MKAPTSVTNMACNSTGLLGFFFAIYGLKGYSQDLSNLQLTLLLLAATALPMILCEVFVNQSYKNLSTGLDFTIRRTPNFQRIATKLIGFYTILSLLALMYSIFPEYRGEFYVAYYELLSFAVPIMVLTAIPYFSFLDCYLVNPEDSYWKLGMAILRKRDYSTENLQLLLGWMVKAFFLPLMFVYFKNDTHFLFNFDLKNILSSFTNSFDFLLRFFFCIDLLYVCIGYMCTLRILDTHIRSTEPTFLGWGIALFCYQPFWSFFSNNYLSYSDDRQWTYWLEGTPFYAAWGICILSLIGIYIWATLAFGIRFSNLTNRGIITNGPYRFTKHPAYLSKNLAWWLISMPFMISTSFQDSFRHCILLFALNMVYFIRAKTEERHLGTDPAYQEYANYIRQHGIFARTHASVPKTEMIYSHPSSIS